jgi:hypothetical protein
MPGGLDPGDRKLLLGAALLFAVVMAATVVLAPGERGFGSPIPSSYSSDSGGALAAYLLLQDLDYDVRRWEAPPTDLGGLGSGVTLIVAEPTEAPTNIERKALREFMERGGRVLFCGRQIPAFFREAGLGLRDPFADWKAYPAALPSHYTRGARQVEMPAWALWGPIEPRQLALYGEAEGAVAVAWARGKGELLWWAGAGPLTNLGLRRADNLQFFLNAIGGAEAPGTVLWDEYYHGQRASLWAYVERTPVAWSLLQIAALAAAALFTFSRRSGPVAASAPVSRLSPLEFVDTLGGLYQHAGATPVALSVAHRRLRLKLARRLGLPVSASDSALARAAGDRLGWKTDDLENALAAAASGEKMSPRKALHAVQAVERHTARLAIRRTQEKR